MVLICIKIEKNIKKKEWKNKLIFGLLSKDFTPIKYLHGHIEALGIKGLGLEKKIWPGDNGLRCIKAENLQFIDTESQ
jgi:hypothetical protein